MVLEWVELLTELNYSLELLFAALSTPKNANKEPSCLHSFGGRETDQARIDTRV